MASSSTTSTLSQCERLPDEVLLRVLEHGMIESYPGWKNGLRAVRGVSRRWRAVHDAACTCSRLHVHVENVQSSYLDRWRRVRPAASRRECLAVVAMPTQCASR